MITPEQRAKLREIVSVPGSSSIVIDVSLIVKMLDALDAVDSEYVHPDVAALRAELKAAQKRIAELEQQAAAIVDDRDYYKMRLLVG